MAMQKPVARVDLIGEAEVAFEPERQDELGEIICLCNRLSQLEGEEVKPDLRRGAVDLVNVGQQRSRPCCCQAAALCCLRKD